MEEDLKSLLAKNIELTRENNEMLKVVKRIIVREYIFKNVYRAIIIGTIVFSIIYASRIMNGIMTMTGMNSLMEAYGIGDGETTFTGGFLPSKDSIEAIKSIQNSGNTDIDSLLESL